MQKRHINALTKREPIVAVSQSLISILFFVSELVGSYAVLQRQSPWKTPFPQFVFEPDDTDNQA